MAMGVAAITTHSVPIIAPDEAKVETVPTYLSASVMRIGRAMSASVSSFYKAGSRAAISVQVVAIITVILVVIEGALTANLSASTILRAGEPGFNLALRGATIRNVVVKCSQISIITFFQGMSEPVHVYHLAPPGLFGA